MASEFIFFISKYYNTINWIRILLIEKKKDLYTSRTKYCIKKIYNSIRINEIHFHLYKKKHLPRQYIPRNRSIFI